MKMSIFTKSRSLRLVLLFISIICIQACGGDSTPIEPDPNQGVEPDEVSLVVPPPFPETFYFGNDLSYVNEMEDCGATFQDGGEVGDPYQIMADHGTNLVRVRHWNDPSWIDMVPQPEAIEPSRQTAYSDLADNIETIQRSKAAGMQTLLDFHFSDFWSDPGRQVVPQAWAESINDQAAMEALVYEYVTSVLTDMAAADALPDMVSVGNESNGGLLNQQTLTVEADSETTLHFEESETINFDNSRVAAMFNAGIKAVRDYSSANGNEIKISLHVTANAAVSSFDWFTSIGVTDFDILGISYYYAWHKDTAATISEAGELIAELASTFPDYEIVIMETGYPWDDANIDGLGNIITDIAPEYAPVSKQNQLKYMTDLVQEVADSGGMGVVFWESAWVSTDCRTPWGQGSSHEHVVSFDHYDNNNFHIGGNWMQSEYMGAKPSEGEVVTFVVDMTGSDTSNGVYISGDFTFDTHQPMLYKGNNVYSYDATLPEGLTGEYYISIASNADSRETVPSDCSSGDNKRAFEIASGVQDISTVWNSCDVFDRIMSTEVRFNVDMSGVEDASAAVITGPFNGWSLDALKLVGDDIYSIIYTLEPGAEIQFHIRSAVDWSGDVRETVSGDCASENDRVITLPDNEATYSVNVVFGSCDTFTYDNPPIPEAALVNVTLNVDMTGVDVTNGVWITGDMTTEGGNWTFVEMTTQGSNIYTTSFTLEEGTTHAYYFLNDDDWGARETGLSGACEVLVYDGDRGLTVGNQTEEKNLVWGMCP